MTGARPCWAYKGSKRPDAYLFVPAEDDFARVPAELLRSLGRLELVLRFELEPRRRMPNADPLKVLAALDSHGYYLQVRPRVPSMLVPKDG